MKFKICIYWEEIMLITNIQRFSLHDGPGIRTTIFLKGCSLRCPWCSNPENLNPYPEKYYKNNNEGVYGKNYTCDEIYNEIIKDKAFYEENGGVTFSGGEALLQVEELIPLARMIKNDGITIAVETCLFIPTRKLKSIIPYVDYFYVDIKILDKNQCKKVIGGDIDLYIKNLDLLTSEKMITIRIPVIGKYTDDLININNIINLVEKYKKKILKIELIKGHNLAESKYESLGFEKPRYFKVNNNFMEQYKKRIEQVTEIEVEICKI